MSHSYKTKISIVGAYLPFWLPCRQEREVTEITTKYRLEYLSTYSSIHSRPTNPYSLQRKKYIRKRGK